MSLGNRQQRWFSVLALALAAAVFAYTRSAPSQPATLPQELPKDSSSEARPAAEPAIHASNQRALNAKVDSEVTVRGLVARAAKSQSGLHFLNLENSSLSIVCFRDDAKKFAKGSPSDQFRAQEVEIRGKLELYKGKLQIKLADPEQIHILKDEDATQPSKQPSGIELKEVSRNTWMSPAGLRYAGRDPAGLTRKEHIERHAADEPDRDGSHGVFDGGSAVAFAVIDEAWNRAQQSQLRATNEGDRSSYLVPMGRRVGYLGGRSGNDRGHPPLKRVFIVFDTGTKNIITAFPR